MKHLGAVVAALVFLMAPSGARGGDVTYFVQLIMATNEDGAKEKGWKSIGPKLQKELSPVFQWKQYWEVSRTKVDVSEAKVSRIRLNATRELAILQQEGRLELRMFRDGKLVRKAKDNVSTQRVIMGGDSSKKEAWFLVVRRDEPSTE